MQMKHCVHLHGHDMLTVPLTVLLHHPITSMTGDCPISAQIRLVITNQVWEYYFVIVLINNGNRTQWSSIWSVIIWVINKIRWPQSRSPICQSRLWLPAELDETKFCYQLIITIIIKKKTKKHLGQTSPSGIMSTVKNLQPTVQLHYPITTVQSD